MPKFVVDLINFDENAKKVKEVLEQLRLDLDSQNLAIPTHDLGVEIRSVIDFKINLKTLFNNSIDKQRQQCNDQKRTPSPLKDEYGNVFLSNTFEYSYAEIVYTNYERFDEVRLLGYANLVNPVRYYFQNLENDSRITPTTLKIFENLEKFIGEDFLKGVLRIIREFSQKIDDACNKVVQTDNTGFDFNKDVLGLEGTKPSRQLAQEFFFPPAVIRQKNADEIKLKNLEEKLKTRPGETPAQTALRNPENSIQARDLRTTISQALEKERQEAKLNALKEQPKTPPLTSGFDPCAPNPPKAIQKDNKIADAKLQRWMRRHSIPCLIKDIKDCYLPPNLDFCQVIFKDPSITTFLTKLESLKAPGTTQIYNQIVSVVEDKIGVKELKEAAQDIQALEFLITDEEELLSYYNEKFNSFDYKMLNEYYPRLDGKKSAILLYETRIASGDLTPEQQDEFRKKIQITQSEIEQLERDIRLLAIERSQISARIIQLQENKQRNETNLENLKSTYETRIRDLNFNAEQAELILRGQNLQAVFNAVKQGDSLNPQQWFDVAVQAVDTIIPFENVCALLFQFGIPSIKWNVSNFDFSATKLKNPFDGLYASFGRLISEFVTGTLLALVDSLLSSLCNTIDNAVANLAISNLKDPNIVEKNLNFETFRQNLINQGYNSILPLLNADYSSIAAFGVDKFNTKIELGLKDPSSRLERTREEICNDNVNITPPIQPVAVSITTQASGVLDFFLGKEQANPLSEWFLGKDGKSFTYQNPPPLFDFSQIDQFINNSVNEFLNPEDGNSNFSLRALIESFVPNEKPPENEIENPCSTTGAPDNINFGVAASELSCLFRNVSSLLTPTQFLDLLTGNASEETKQIIARLLPVCTPTITGRMGNNPTFFLSAMSEAGKASGAEEFLNTVKDLIDKDSLSPSTIEITCERYDNTRQFIQNLLSESMAPSLAKEVLGKIEEKRIQNFNYILDSFATAAVGKSLPKPQSSLKFYIEVVEKLIDAKQNGENPQSLDELGYVEPEKEQSNDIRDMFLKEEEYYKSRNPTHNAMMELASESILRPLRRSFKNDISSYINVMSGLKKVIKEVPLEEERNGSEILSLDYMSSIFGETVPVLKIPTNTTVTLSDPSIVISVQAEIDNLNKIQENLKKAAFSIKNRIENDGQDGLRAREDPITDIINELSRRYKNSEFLNTEERIQYGDINRGKLSRLNSNFTEFFKSTTLIQKRGELIIHVDLDKTRKDILDIDYKTNEIVNSSTDFAQIIASDTATGNYVSYHVPTQEELDGPPYTVYNPYGEDLCFVFDEKNRKLCSSKLVLEVTYRALLSICILVRRTIGNKVVEKWVLPNSAIRGGLLESLSYTASRKVQNKNIGKQGDAIVFFDSFKYFDLNISSNENSINNPFYNQNTDEVIIELFSQKQKYEKINLIPLLSKETLETIEELWSYCRTTLLKCKDLQFFIDNQFVEIGKEYFDGLKSILYAKKVGFSISNDKDVKLEKLPSWILPFEKSLGQSSIKTNRVILDNINLDEGITKIVIGPTTFPAHVGDYYYISNGYVQDSYRNPFINSNKSPQIKNYITSSENVVGEKFIQNLDNIPSYTTIFVEENFFKIEIKGKHDSSNGNPFLQNPDIFYPKDSLINNNVVQTGDCATTQTDLTLTPAAGLVPLYPTVLEQPVIEEKCYDQIIEDPNSGIRNSDSTPRTNDLKGLLSRATPSWELYFKEVENSIEYGVKTSGLIFSPIGKKYDFYHNTEIVKQISEIDVNILSLIEEKYGSFKNKTNSFVHFFDEKTKRDINKIIINERSITAEELSNSLSVRRQVPLLNPVNNSLPIDLQDFYKILVQNYFNKFVKSFSNNRLLSDFKKQNNSLLEISEKDKISKKMLEMVPFIREQTEYERKNNLQPSIMDIESIKKEFFKLYSSMESDNLTNDQAIGRTSSNSKSSKSAKNIFLISLIKIVTTEHVLKSIFIYDQIKYSKQCTKFEFVIKDIANFVLQEASRFGVSGLIHRQANELYAIKVKEGKLEESQVEKNKFKKWISSNSYEGKVASPKLEALVGLEYKKVLTKFSKITNCGTPSNDVSYLRKSLLEEYKVIDAPSLITHKLGTTFGSSEVSQGFSNIWNKVGIDGPITSEEIKISVPIINNFSLNDHFYFEKYVKLGRLNPNLDNLFPDLYFTIKENILTNDVIENSVLSLEDFHELLSNLTQQHRDSFFLCENKENSIFIEQPKFGIRLMIKVNITGIGELLPSVKVFDFNQTTIEANDVLRNKSYCIYATDFHLASSSGLETPNLGNQDYKPRPWTEEEQRQCLVRFGVDCDEAVADRKIEDTREYIDYLERQESRFSEQEEQSLQGYTRQFYKVNNLIVSEEETPFDISLINSSLEQLRNAYENIYYGQLKSKIVSNPDTTVMFDYCLSIEEMLQLFIVNSNLVHNDQQGRYLFESSKSYITDMTKRLKDYGNKTKITSNLARMLNDQQQRENNIGSPLGPSLEALKFFYRTPIQILKGQATLTDPNLAIADKIVAAGAMAGALSGQKIDIPYKVASLAMLPFPLFNGVAPPIPPLTSYNMVMPAGITFLALEHLLKDLPYYQNESLVNENTNDANADNPFFCEMTPEENED